MAHETVTEAEVDAKILTHKGDSSAHHAKTSKASEITSERFPVDRLPALTDGKIWKGTGGNVEEVDMPSSFAPGDDLLHSYDPELFVEGDPGEIYIKKMEFYVPLGGELRIKFDLKASHSVWTAYGRIYRNGIAVGTEQTVLGTTYGTRSEDIAGWSAGDLLQLYLKINATGGMRAYARNLRVYATTGGYEWMTGLP